MKEEKDWDHIARVEKAIAEKYGKESVQNPAKLWNEEKEKEYIEQLKEDLAKQDEKIVYQDKIEADGFFISKKLINKDTGRTCPTCGKYSFSTKDDVYMSKYECCFKCYIQYVEGRTDRWLEGWRPNHGEKRKHDS